MANTKKSVTDAPAAVARVEYRVLHSMVGPELLRDSVFCPADYEVAFEIERLVEIGAIEVAGLKPARTDAPAEEPTEPTDPPAGE